MELKERHSKFEKSLKAFCKQWDVSKDENGNYIDTKTQYAWEEFYRINYSSMEISQNIKNPEKVSY